MSSTSRVRHGAEYRSKAAVLASSKPRLAKRVTSQCICMWPALIRMRFNMLRSSASTYSEMSRSSTNNSRNVEVNVADMADEVVEIEVLITTEEVIAVIAVIEATEVIGMADATTTTDTTATGPNSIATAIKVVHNHLQPQILTLPQSILWHS